MTFGDVRFALSKLLPGVDPDALDTSINSRIESIARHMPWKALEADAWFASVAMLNAGSVAVTAGSASITLTGSTFPNALNYRLRVLGRNESYLFTYASPTAGTLDRVYEGATGTALGYQLFRNIYPLPADYAKPISEASNTRLNVDLRYIDHPALNAMDPSRLRIGEPFFYAETSRAANGTRQAELYPAPQFVANYPFRYVRKLTPYAADDTALAIPDWISTPCLMAGVRADLGKDGQQAAAYEYELSQMRKEDAAARGAQVLKMAPVFTRHRMDRVLRNLRRPLP